jgi:hypothetical protein
MVVRAGPPPLPSLGPGGPVAAAGKSILSKGMLNKDRIFNNKGISDHFAIIPTGESPAAPLEGDDGRDGVL